VLVLVLIGWLGWTWYRSSSFVKVEHVTITGVAGPDVVQIRDALTSTAMGMTTLDMKISKLEASVSAYPYVDSLTVTRQGSHAVRIAVNEEVPVALVNVGGNAEVTDGDGQILPDTTIAHGALPTVPIKAAPAGDVITASGARAAIAVLSAAPYALLSHIANATSSTTHGVIVQLRNGPQVYFGQTSQLHAKWQAMAAVLQDRAAAGADYIDVSDPQRPAAGVGVSTRQAVALGLVSNGATTAGQGPTNEQ
jgi:cell division protein FtsQ